jgi:GT2 family glycosyltransferase
MTRFDLIIPTYNRPELLAKVIESITQARMPDDFALRVIVADNNSSISNQAANKAVLDNCLSLDLVYLLVHQQGRSHALNHGVVCSETDYVGFIDDDEKIDVAWLEVVASYIRKGEIDYLGGPYKPDWEAPAPAWLPIHVGKYKGVLGWIEQNADAQPFDDFGGGLCGGNLIIRRRSLLDIGGFSTSIGRSAGNLMGGEDDELQRKLRLHGYRGMYDPALTIYHFIPTERMTRHYHLSWAFWSGATNGVRLGWLPPEPVPKLFGLPRYRFGLAIGGLALYLRMLLSGVTHAKAKGFTGLLDAIYLIGTLYGRHFLPSKKA